MSNSSRKLNIAVIGIGRMGRHHSENVAFASPRSNLVAVCDNQLSSQEWSRKNLPEGTAIYSTYQECLNHPGLDAVVISCITSMHAIIAVAALEKGLHVLLEKPISIDMASSTPVVEAAKKYSKQKIMVALSRRFDASYRDAHQRIVNGELGKPYLIKSATNDQYDDSGFFISYSKASGGIQIDCGIHDIDCARFLLGIGLPVDGVVAKKQVKRVFAIGINARHPELAEMGDADNALSIIEFENGTMCNFHLSRTAIHGHECVCEVHGEKGKFVINQNPRMNRLEIMDKHGVRAVSTQTYYDRFEEAFITEIKEFTACVLDDTPLPVTVDDAIQAAKIATALTWCFRTGKTVYFDDEGEPIAPTLVANTHL